MSVKRLVVGGFLALLVIASVNAHGDGLEGSNDLSAVSPFHAFSEGRIVFGIVLFILWIVVLRGIYVLLMLVLSRGLKSDTKKRKKA